MPREARTEQDNTPQATSHRQLIPNPSRHTRGCTSGLANVSPDMHEHTRLSSLSRNHGWQRWKCFLILAAPPCRAADQFQRTPGGWASRRRRRSIVKSFHHSHVPFPLLPPSLPNLLLALLLPTARMHIQDCAIGSSVFESASAFIQTLSSIVCIVWTQIAILLHIRLFC